MNYLFIFILFTIATANSFSQSDTSISAPKSYNEFVFPPNINKYPLLFSTFWTNNDAKISDSHKKQASSQISQFIKNDKLMRGLDHLLIDDTEGKEYDISTYRYIVFTKPFSQITVTPTPPSSTIPGPGSPSQSTGGVKYGHYITLAFYIKDRQTSKTYACFGSPPSKPMPTYAAEDIGSASPSAFFSALNRIISNLETKSVDETFDNELKLQQRPAKVRIVGEVIMYTILAGGVAWYVYDIID